MVWIINTITMGILSLFQSSPKNVSRSTPCVGRHQSRLAVHRLLGYTVSTVDFQLAANKDRSERMDIEQRLAELEIHMQSDEFTTIFDVQDVWKDINEILDKGYDYCVLQADSELESKAIYIYDNIVEYTLSSGNSGFSEEDESHIRELSKKRAIQGILQHITLNDSLKTADEQMAWMILCSLDNPHKSYGGFAESNLITISLELLTGEDLQRRVKPLQLMKDRLRDQGVISTDEAGKVESMIESGIQMSRKLHH